MKRGSSGPHIPIPPFLGQCPPGVPHRSSEVHKLRAVGAAAPVHYFLGLDLTFLVEPITQVQVRSEISPMVTCFIDLGSIFSSAVYIHSLPQSLLMRDL